MIEARKAKNSFALRAIAAIVEYSLQESEEPTRIGVESDRQSLLIKSITHGEAASELKKFLDMIESPRRLVIVNSLGLTNLLKPRSNPVDKKAMYCFLGQTNVSGWTEEFFKRISTIPSLLGFPA
jgi:hypothetical protein